MAGRHVGILTSGVAMLIATGFVFWYARRLKRFSAENQTGIDALQAGEIEVARERFEVLARSWKRYRSFERVSLFNLAWSELLLCDLDTARDRFALLEAERSKRVPDVVSKLVPSRLAYLHALSGAFVDARHWLDVSAERRSMSGSDISIARAFESAARAVIDCREGGPDRAANDLAKRWLELENSATGELMRPLRAIRAFAIDASASGASRTTADALLASLRDAPSPGLRHLGARWPEMGAFLERHGLG